MKLKNWLAMGVSLFALNALTADDCNREPCPSLCDMCEPCEGWSAQVDWIYWKVRKSGLDYAVKNAGTNPYDPQGKIYEVDPGYESGVRVAVFKACDNFDVGLRYTWLDSEESDSITTSGQYLDATRGLPAIFGPRIPDSVLPLSTAKSKYDFKLNKVDVESGYLYSICNGMVHPFAGFQYSSIDQELDTNYSPGLALYKVDEENDMDAYGLYAGLEGQKDLWCNFGFYARFSAGLSVAEFDRYFRLYFVDTTTNTTTLETKAYKEEWLVVPNWEIAVGLTYDLCDFYCVDWSLTVGYEYHQWCCLPDFLNFDDNSDTGHLARNRSNLGYDGLFVRVNAAF